MRYFSLILISFIYSASLLAGEISLGRDGLNISAVYEKISEKKSDGTYFLYGKLEIKNKSEIEKNYSNKDLILEVGSEQSRTYMDTVASNVIDFSYIKIFPGEEKPLDVYWVFHKPVNTENQSVSLKWN